MKVHDNSPVPVRAQLRQILSEEISGGVFAPNQRIPSERDLAERYGASRASVREAIMEMISAGLLFRSAGRGTFVADTRQTGALPVNGSHQLAFWISADIFHFVEAGYTRILTGVEEVCRAEQFALNFYSVGDDEQAVEPIFRNPPHSAAVGHIVAGGLRRAMLEKVQKLDRAMVLVDALMRPRAEGVDSVRIDYASGTRDAVRHLAELGHRDVGFIGFANSDKYESYWRTLEELNLRYSARFVQFVEVADLTPSIVVGFQSVNALLAQAKRPSAILVANDYIALGALEALAIAGLRVPDDISIVGFDDLGQGTLPLTTVRCDLVETGRVAARTVLDRLRQPDKPRSDVVVPVSLIVRKSTAPHAALVSSV